MFNVSGVAAVGWTPPTAARDLICSTAGFVATDIEPPSVTSGRRVTIVLL